MKIKILIFAMLFLTMMMFLVGCKTPDIPEELKCTTNEDCVANSCCHSSSCINQDYKPNCEGLDCTMECAPGTMDCGQGSCVCENNKCEAKIG